jgi:hypothetical protein
MQQHIASMRRVPAIAWLDSNRNEYPLASNRFGRAAEARKFVQHLLDLGAIQVFVADPKEEESRIKLEGGPYADTLVVELPSSTEKRRQLFAIFTAEAAREGFAPEQDVGQPMVLLWWD